MSTLAHDWLPDDTPIFLGQYGAGHRVTDSGPACGSEEQTRRTTVLAAAGHSIPACPACWGGGRPW